VSLEDELRPRTPADRLGALRTDDRQRAMVVLGGVLIGLSFGSLHWTGLVLGGAIVALPARTIPRGLAHGLGLGVIGLVVFAGLLAWQGALAGALTTGMVGAITVVIGLAAPVVGSLVRAVV
jgi:hypothetical protein